MTIVFFGALLVGVPIGLIYARVQYRRALRRAQDAYQWDREKYLEKIRKLDDAIGKMKTHKTFEEWDSRPMDVEASVGNLRSVDSILDQVDEF